MLVAGIRALDKKLIAIGVVGLALAGGLFYRLVTWVDPEPDKVGMFSGPDMPNTRGIGVLEYLERYFASLSPVQWLLFAAGTLVAVFLIIGIPQLLDKYGGDNWK